MRNYRRKMIHEFTIGACLNQLEALDDKLEEFLQQAQDMPEPDYARYAIKLAVHELVTNIIRHAYAYRIDGKIDFQLSLSQGEFSAMLCDCGRQFIPQDVADPDLENGQEGGYGIFLIEQLMDQVTYRRIADENRWHLVKLW